MQKKGGRKWAEFRVVLWCRVVSVENVLIVLLLLHKSRYAIDKSNLPVAKFAAVMHIFTRSS